MAAVGDAADVDLLCAGSRNPAYRLCVVEGCSVDLECVELRTGDDDGYDIGNTVGSRDRCSGAVINAVLV